jgi:2-hydroxychromene-2-carboxylate isomerase
LLTDPGCPVAFSAEPRRLRLEWLYGDQLRWEIRMVVLRRVGEPTRLDTKRVSDGMRRLALEHGMPIDWRERRTVAPTEHACRAVVAVRLGWPGREDAFLRMLRVLAMGGEPLDDSDTFELAAARVRLPVDEVAAYAGRPDVQAALDEDAALARRPTPAALAQPDRLAGPPHARRYTCPSYLFDGTIDVPGLQPFESYEAALGNLDPGLERREDPASVEEVLAWAPYPLATVEVAAVCARELPEVRSELARVARFEPVGFDGYWSPF